MAEVINLTKKRGSVEPAAIKKEIERYVDLYRNDAPSGNGWKLTVQRSLIEKDYIEREDNAYTYLA